MNALRHDRTTDAIAELLGRLDLIEAEAVGRRITVSRGVDGDAGKVSLCKMSPASVVDLIMAR
jgi:hypothetical protein